MRNAFADGCPARLPLSVGSRASVSMKRLILVEYYRHYARVNRSLNSPPPAKSQFLFILVDFLRVTLFGPEPK